MFGGYDYQHMAVALRATQTGYVQKCREFSVCHLSLDVACTE